MFLTIMMFAVTSLAHADCSKFDGKWVAVLNCQGLSPHSGVKIEYYPGDQTLTLIYDFNSKDPFPPQHYTADGNEHQGDLDNTGDKYRASCNGDVLRIRRVFSTMDFPVVEEMTLQDGGVDYVETFEGRNGATVCRFERR